MTSANLTGFLEARTRDGRTCTYAQYSAAANDLAKSTPADTGLPELRVAILRNFTLEPLIPVLAGELYYAGFHPSFYVGPFDAIEADVMNPASALYAFRPDFVILALWLEALSPTLSTAFLSTASDERAQEPARIEDRLRNLIAALNANVKAPVLLNNFPLPTAPTLGILDGQSTPYHTSALLELNARLVALAGDLSDVYVVDFMRLFATHGSAAMVDERYWHIARAPLAKASLLPIGVEYGKFVRALRGRTKKCLVLDCDNTLWGGIIGEDGIAGIKVGPTYPGSGFLALQQEILNLHDRGVILALCSKNNEADVLEVLRDHPDMLLKEHHFAARQINWDDKVTNLRRIAEELNIGLDSLVFVDDSAFETDYVRGQLPEVTVIRLPEKAYASYRAEITWGGLFDSLTYTAEDRRKNAMYAENRQRRELQAASGSLEDFLATLNVEVEIRTPSPIDIPRVSQMTQKTNQFNLTTRRYSVDDINAFLASGDSDVFSVRVRDRVADLGLVGMAIVRYDGGTANLDTFLLSCRAIGRGVEEALLATVARHAAREKRARRIVGSYIPTDKNAMVKDFYATHDFRELRTDGTTTTWERDIGDATNDLQPPAWISITTGEATV